VPTRRTSPAAALITAVPEADRARAFVAELRTRIKATYVVFTRYDQSGLQTEMVLGEDHGNPARQAEWLQAERLLQSRSETPIPRVTDAMIALDGLRGLVAVYGVDRAIFGLAIVARPRAFAPEERQELEATLRPGSELMRRLSTFEGEQTAQERTANALRRRNTCSAATLRSSPAGSRATIPTTSCRVSSSCRATPSRRWWRTRSVRSPRRGPTIR
jgi:hypothetical protein